MVFLEEKTTSQTLTFLITQAGELTINSVLRRSTQTIKKTNAPLREMNGTKKKSSLDYSLSLSKYNKLCLPSASLPQQIFMREPKEYCQTSAPQAYSQSLPLFISLTQTCQSYTTHKQILPNLGKSCSCNLNFLTGNKSCNVCGFLADPFSESAGMLADPACHSQTVQIG